MLEYAFFGAITDIRVNSKDLDALRETTVFQRMQILWFLSLDLQSVISISRGGTEGKTTAGKRSGGGESSGTRGHETLFCIYEMTAPLSSYDVLKESRPRESKSRTDIAVSKENQRIGLVCWRYCCNNQGQDDAKSVPIVWVSSIATIKTLPDPYHRPGFRASRKSSTVKYSNANNTVYSKSRLTDRFV